MLILPPTGCVPWGTVPSVSELRVLAHKTRLVTALSSSLREDRTELEKVQPESTALTQDAELLVTWDVYLPPALTTQQSGKTGTIPRHFEGL